MRSLRTLLLLILAGGLSSAAHGSGFLIPEQGAKASSMAGAFAGTADDPSAIFYNVAGIAQIRRTTLIGGGTFINFNNLFTGDPNDEFSSGSTGRYNRHTFIPPNAYAVLPIGESLTVGVGVFSAFGLRTSWQDPWIGRFASRDADLKTLSVEPAIAWQSSTGRVAVGAGIEYRRSKVTLNRNNPLTGSGVNPFTGRIVDVANVYLTSPWESDWGWSAGVLLKPSDRFRIGLSYRAPMDIEYKGDATFTQIPTGNAQLDALVRAQLPPNQGVNTTVPFPAITALGLGTTLGRWDWDLDITQTTWSRFKALPFRFATTPALNQTRPQNWEDTISYRLGTNGRVTENWDVRLGVVYDENPEPLEAVSPLLPDADRTGVTMGLGYHRGPWIIDAGVMFLDFAERGTQGHSTDLNGTYETNATLWFTNLGLRF